MSAVLAATPVYIDTPAKLQALCQQLQQVSVLALDTEFIRTDTFYPIGALIQLSDGAACYLIDPLAIADLSPLAALMTAPAIVKVLHSCSEDLEVFDRLLGVLPQPLFDTQIAATLDGHGFSVGYQRLVDMLLGEHLPKHETRSDWLQRPLTHSQIHYAALDVAYLPGIYQQLSTSLVAKGRLSWLQEECAALLQRYTDNQRNDYHDAYLKVKSGWKLSRQQLAVLRALCAWREREARVRDKPRGHLVKDNACFDLARLQPANLQQLQRIDGFSYGAVRKNGDALLDIIAQAQALPSSSWPPLLPKPLPPAAGKILKVLKQMVTDVAQQLDIAPEFIVRKKDYEELLRSGHDSRHYQLPASLCGWRQAVVGDDLVKWLERADA